MVQPPEGKTSSGHASRRTFLKGAGLAGAAGLAAPLLARTSARAAGGLIPGINAPGPWVDFCDIITGRPVGSRSYRDTVLKTPDDVPTTFPGETDPAGSKVVASIQNTYG